MSDSVIITAIICGTLLAIYLIGTLKKGGRNNGSH